MSLIRKITLTYVTFFFVAIASAGFAVWGSFISHYNLERTTLANAAFEIEMNLHLNVTRLFDEMEDSIVAKSSPSQVESDLKLLVKEDFRKLRAVTTQEILMVGQEEADEIQAIAKLESDINAQVSRYEALRREISGSENNLTAKQIISLIAKNNDISIDDQITAALEEERQEVKKTSAQSHAVMSFKRWVALFLGLVAVAASYVCQRLILLRFSRPLKAIVQGAERFATGEYRKRIEIDEDGELKHIADTVNDAARLAEERQETLHQANARLEREVQERTAELHNTILTLEEQQKQRQQLLADVSHELRTPLTIIQGEVDVALRGGDKDPKDYKEALRRAGDAAKHTTQLVNDVLFIGRHELGQSKLKIRQNDLVTLLVDAVDTMNAYQEHHNVSIVYKADLNDAVVAMDADRMRQVILILIENACKYGGTIVEVCINRAPGGYVFAVRDDGPGIEEGEREQLFQRFFRGSNAAERYEGGAGLGLPVAKSIVEAHGGRIEVVSVPGCGAEFTVYVPEKNALKAVS